MLELVALLLVLFTMAHLMPFSLLRRLKSMTWGPESADDSATNSDEYAGPTPTPIDIVIVRIMLSRGKRLPPDIVDAIFDHAEYWAHSSNEIDYLAEHRQELRISGTSPSKDKFLVCRQFRKSGVEANRPRSDPIP